MNITTFTCIERMVADHTAASDISLNLWKGLVDRLCLFDKIYRYLELVSKELNHFGMIAGLFRQIGRHSSIMVLVFSF